MSTQTSIKGAVIAVLAVIGLTTVGGALLVPSLSGTNEFTGTNTFTSNANVYYGSGANLTNLPAQTPEGTAIKSTGEDSGKVLTANGSNAAAWAVASAGGVHASTHVGSGGDAIALGSLTLASNGTVAAECIPDPLRANSIYPSVGGYIGTNASSGGYSGILLNDMSTTSNVPDPSAVAGTIFIVGTTVYVKWADGSTTVIVTK